MNTRIKADAWTYYSVLILGFIALASVFGVIVLTWMRQPVPEAMIMLGFMAIASLGRLLISPLNQELFE